ncbi:MAG: AraC family transcriptional regulator, partial [Pseudomonadota bacterium]
MRDGPVEVAVALGPRFALMSLAAATEVLRVANRVLGAPAFHRSIVTVDGQPVQSSSGIEIAAAASVETAPHPAAVVVLTSFAPEEACAPALLAWLRRQDRAGAVIAAADTGALLLSRAGVLRDRQVAVHHEATPAFREALGEAILLDRLHAEHGSLLSSGGGVSTVDMMLRLVARFRGQALADNVAVTLNHRPLPERPERPVALVAVDRRVGRMVEIMQSHL